MRLVQIIALVAFGAALTLAAAPPPAYAKGDALAPAAKAARKSFKSAASEADRTFASVATGLQRGLASGATTSEDAVLGFGDALAFFASTLKQAADDAALEFADAATSRMLRDGDPTLAGAVAGDGGSYDALAEDLAKNLAKFRAKAVKRIARFRKAVAKDGGARVELRARLEAWTVSPRPVPTIDGPIAPWDEPLRLWGVVLTRLTDGRVAFTVFGSAPATRDERFDVRLQGESVRALGDFLADGGMDVEIDGTWRRSGTLGDPFQGDGVQTGPRQVTFGVDPEDQGLAGLQPTRREHAGAISVP